MCGCGESEPHEFINTVCNWVHVGWTLPQLPPWEDEPLEKRERNSNMGPRLYKEVVVHFQNLIDDFLCCIFLLCKMDIVIVVFLQRPGSSELNTSTGPVNQVEANPLLMYNLTASPAADHSWAQGGTKAANSHIPPPWKKLIKKELSKAQPRWVTGCSAQHCSATELWDSWEITIISYLWALSSHLFEIFWLWAVQKCWWKAHKHKTLMNGWVRWKHK